MSVGQAILSSGFSLLAVAAYVLIRWRLGAGRWAAHPGGAKGHLRDVMLSKAAWAPVIVAALMMRVLMVVWPPAPNAPPPQLLLLLAGFALVPFLYRLPAVRAANARLHAHKRAGSSSQVTA